MMFDWGRSNAGYLASEFAEQHFYPKIYPNKFVAAPGTLWHRAAVGGLPQTIAAAR